MDATALLLLILFVIGVCLALYYAVICLQANPPGEKRPRHPDMGPLLPLEHDLNGNNEDPFAPDPRRERIIDQPDSTPIGKRPDADAGTASPPGHGSGNEDSLEPPPKSVMFQTTPGCASKEPPKEGAVVLPIDEEPSLLDGSKSLLPLTAPQSSQIPPSRPHPVTTKPRHSADPIPVLAPNGYEEDGLRLPVFPQQLQGTGAPPSDTLPRDSIPSRQNVHPKKNAPKQVHFTTPIFSAPCFNANTNNPPQFGRPPTPPVKGKDDPSASKAPPPEEPITPKVDAPVVCGAKHKSEEDVNPTTKRAKKSPDEDSALEDSHCPVAAPGQVDEGETLSRKVPEDDIKAATAPASSEIPIGWNMKPPQEKAPLDVSPEECERPVNPSAPPESERETTPPAEEVKAATQPRREICSAPSVREEEEEEEEKVIPNSSETYPVGWHTPVTPEENARKASDPPQSTLPPAEEVKATTQSPQENRSTSAAEDNSPPSSPVEICADDHDYILPIVEGKVATAPHAQDIPHLPPNEAQPSSPDTTDTQPRFEPILEECPDPETSSCGLEGAPAPPQETEERPLTKSSSNLSVDGSESDTTTSSSDPDVTEYSFQSSHRDVYTATVLANEVSSYSDEDPVGLTNYAPLTEPVVTPQEKHRIRGNPDHHPPTPPTPTSDNKSPSPIGSNDTSLDELPHPVSPTHVLGTPPSTPPGGENSPPYIIEKTPVAEESDAPPPFIVIEPYKSSRERLDSASSSSSSTCSSSDCLSSSSTSNGSYKIEGSVKEDRLEGAAPPSSAGIALGEKSSSNVPPPSSNLPPRL